jgi:phospholipase C
VTSISSDTYQDQDNLQKIDHFVVLMLENRSFDQMLGYLELEGHDVDGVKPPTEDKPYINYYNNTDYPLEPTTRTALTTAEDPCHDGWCVADQLSTGYDERTSETIDNGGFVRNFAVTHPAADPSIVMKYFTAEQVPVYNYLANQFCVGDRWFSSVPGATWPNRLYAVAGTAAGSLDNEALPLYNCSSFLRQFDKVSRRNGSTEPSWRWYSSDPATLRLFDNRYSLEVSDRFAYFDWSTMLQRRTFLRDAARGELPSFSWIDPNFVDLGGLTGANDDHPPTDIMAGQELVLKVYNVLATSPLWEKTLLLIVYDEHGGFYDHVSPPDGLPDKDPRFRRYGVRVPAIFVSPWVEPKRHSHTVFDHTSIIKTALLRFCGKDAEECIKAMGPRVEQANHLGGLLTREEPLPPPLLDREEEVKKVVKPLVDWRASEIKRRLLYPLADTPSIARAEPVGLARQVFNKVRNAAIEQVSQTFGWHLRVPGASKPPPVQLEQPRHEFEQNFFTGAKELRRRGLPTGQP